MTLHDFVWPFEKEAIALEDGTEIVLQEATRRWASPHSGDGLAVTALYEFVDNDYILIDIHGDRFVGGRKASKVEAFFFLRRMQAEIPPYLRSGRPVRNLDHWCGKRRLETKAKVGAHEAQLQEILKEIVRAGIQIVQHYHDSKLDLRRKQTHEILGEMVGALYERYPVDPDQWRGPKAQVPPAHLGLLELPWPAGTENMRSVLQEMQRLLEPPLTWIMWDGRRVDNVEAPTYEETKAAEEALRQRIPQLELLVGKIRGHVADLEKETALEDLRENQSVKVPSKDAFLAYELRELTGATQKEIAKMICTATGATTEQGTVSRWLTQVDRWISQGNSIPAPDRKLLRKVLTVNPEVLDLGARQDSRTLRQRDQRDDS